VTAGDSGPADCDSGAIALQQPSVMFEAAVPEVTAVGGTEFNEGNVVYWNAQTGAALGYIPEMAWNDSNASGIAAGGGGPSRLYTKPIWQTGLGVPADSARDLPDVSFAASTAHDPYTIITSGQTALIGGTSVTAPVFAGMVALLNQSQKANGLGNINPNLYKLAATSPSIFHDITAGTTKVPCQAALASCVNGFFGYAAGPGYDFATGLGSVDAFNLVNGWNGSLAVPTIMSLSPPSVLAGSPSFTLTINGANFDNSAVVYWNGQALPTTFVSATQVRAAVDANLVPTSASALVQVTASGRTSAAATFLILRPPIDTVSFSAQRVTTQVPADTSCTIPPPSTSFLTTDSTVYLFFNATTTAADVVNNDWLAPDGTVVDGVTWPKRDGSFCFTGASLAVANLPAKQLGTWTARVFGNGTPLFSIAFTVQAGGPPPPSITAVKNAASYASGVVSPGEIVVILGTALGPAELSNLKLDSAGYVATSNAGTSVKFNEFPAPLIYVSSTAIAAVVPYEITGSTARVVVTAQGKASAAFNVDIGAAVPGIFTANASGTGPAAAVKLGNIFVLYSTGEGATSPDGVDGKPAGPVLPQPVLPVHVFIGGVEARVRYAGGAPGEVSGVLQINVEIPPNVSGPAVPVMLQVGDRLSQSGVTISIP
jgi:uncharacterized protein (TIGR03437 family)